MADLEGKPYRDLPQAFRYQTSYVADCTCHGNPWDVEARTRHEAYAQAPKPTDKEVKSAEQLGTVAPQRRTFGYRDHRAREKDE